MQDRCGCAAVICESAFSSTGPCLRSLRERSTSHGPFRSKALLLCSNLLPLLTPLQRTACAALRTIPASEMCHQPVLTHWYTLYPTRSANAQQPSRFLPVRFYRNWHPSTEVTSVARRTISLETSTSMYCALVLSVPNMYRSGFLDWHHSQVSLLCRAVFCPGGRRARQTRLCCSYLRVGLLFHWSVFEVTA